MKKLFGMFRRVWSASRGVTFAALALVATFLAAPVASAASSYSNLVSYASSTGDIDFAPGSLVTGVIGGAIAAAVAGGALFVLSVGIRWVFRMLKGSR